MRNAGMGKWYGLILAAVLMLSILTLGCTDTTPGGPAPVVASPLQPGQVLLGIGEVSGQGIISQGVPRGTIDTLTFTLGLAPGIKSVDLTKLVIIYGDAVRTETLTPLEGLRGNPPQGSWGVLAVHNEVGNPNFRLEFEEQVDIRVNPKSPVLPNQVVAIIVKPLEGTPLTMRRIAPATILAAENVLPAL
jgi:archaellin